MKGATCAARRSLIWITSMRSRRLILLEAASAREDVMKQVKVLGSGCANCRSTVRLIEEVAQSQGVDIALEKVERIEDIVAAGVMRTPGVIIDGRIVHSGGVPSRDAVAGWLRSA
jgi:small redox-active disulfide protein 2